MKIPQLILASSSPRRRELLGTLGIPFTIIKPDIDESQQPGEAPLDYVRRLSREKAEAVGVQLYPHPAPKAKPSPLHRDGEKTAILAADTVVILGADTLGVDEQGIILGKPEDAEAAREMLVRLRGRMHQVCTALTVVVYETPSPGIEEPHPHAHLSSLTALSTRWRGGNRQTQHCSGIANIGDDYAGDVYGCDDAGVYGCGDRGVHRNG